MKAKAFLLLDLGNQIRQLDEWDDGKDEPGFKEFVLDFFDNVIFPFPPGSTAENWSDVFLSTFGGMGFDQVAETVKHFLSIVTDAKLTAGLAARLP